jgi:hypothetical protein
MSAPTHLASIRARDAAAQEWFAIPSAIHDRRWLLAEVDRLTAELAAAQVAPLADGQFFGEGP